MHQRELLEYLHLPREGVRGYAGDREGLLRRDRRDDPAGGARLVAFGRQHRKCIGNLCIYEAQESPGRASSKASPSGARSSVWRVLGSSRDPMNRPGLLGRYCVFSCGSTDLRSGHVVPANDTGLVEEPDAQARHRADPLAVLLDVREPLHSGALADHQTTWA